MSEFIGLSNDQELPNEKEKIPLDIMIFDTLFNPDTIENMQILDLMDDALSIDLIDLLKMLEYMNFSVTKEELIKIIGFSQFYVFDEQNNKMRLRHKLQRRTIVFPSYDKKEDIREFFKTKLQCDEKIKSIEKLSSGIIFIYFDSEEETIEVFKNLEKYKYDNNLELYASIRCENLKRKLTDRIEMKIKQSNNELFNPYSNTSHIIEDKEHYVPRRLEGESLAKCYRGRYPLFSEIPYLSYKNNDYFLIKHDSNKKRSHSFFEVDPIPVEEKVDLTPKGRKNTNNKFDGDVRSSIKNYYNKYNLVFDPEKYSFNRRNSGKLLRRRSMVLDLDSLPDRRTQSNIIHRYSLQEILQYFEDYQNQRTQRPKEFEKFIPPIMTYTSKLTLDQFREKKEKRERASTFFESAKKGYELYQNNSFKYNNNNQNNVNNKLGNNNHNFKFTIYNPGRRRIGSYNLIN